MHRFCVKALSLTLGLLIVPVTYAQPAAREQLLEQVRLGEATQRDDLVRQTLYRLELMDPDNPDVIAARLRYQLRQGDNAGAQQQLARLEKLAPDSAAYRQSRLAISLTSPEGRQQLQQARLLGTTGHVPEALATYQKLFNGDPPVGDLAVEYWSLAAKEPTRRKEAIGQLRALRSQLPGNVQLNTTLAQLLLANNQREEGFTVLEQMAKTSTGREAAAQIWFQQLQDMPISDASVAALQHFLTIFSGGDNVVKARALLAEQQSKLADPAFRARAQGLAALESGRSSGAEGPLEQALRAKPDDGEVNGALGQIYSQQGNRAKAVPLLEKALRLEPNSPNNDKWASLLKVNRYWLLIDEGDAALKKGATAQARKFYQQARGVDNSDSYAVLGLGDVAVAEKNDPAAERYYRQALALESDNSNALRGLANLYRRQSPEKASAFIAGLSASQRRSIADIERSLTSDRLEQEATTLEQQGHFAEAAERHRQRLEMDPDSVWITYRLAKDLAAAGRRDEADLAFTRLGQRRPGDADMVYARSLYLSGNDRDREALAQLRLLPEAKWTPTIRQLARRLQDNALLAEANRLRDNGQEPQAIALLTRQPASTRIDLTLADWAQQRGDNPQAQARYQQVLQREPQNADARLGLVEVLLDEGQRRQARRELARLSQNDATPPSLNTQRRVANARAALGDRVAAGRAFAALIPQAKAQPASMESALALRDAARFQQHQAPQQALDTLRDAMVASGISPTRPQDNISFTRLTRNDKRDDWLKRSVRSDAADLYRQQDVNVTLEHDYWGSSGTPGYSDLQAHTTMLQVDAPLYDGRMLFRTDVVDMNVGRFAADADGRYDPNWGTCYDTPCSGDRDQRDRGVSLAVGWRNDRWQGDIGTTPMGFRVVDVVGSLSYSGDLGPFGYTAGLHRRPISSSLLAFGGQRDARSNTGTTWGGVRASGGALNMSYDKGEANGVWASLGGDQLTGKNVADNWRVRWMGGYYYKLINENNQRLTVGLNNMIWHYQKDLSGYSLGQGGYYSPQEYISFAAPVTWRRRTSDWSWELGGSVSWSHSRTHSQRRYPLQGLIPTPVRNADNSDLNRYTDKDAMESGGTGTGFGYTARALVERRLTDNWFLGAGVDIQQAKDYTPSHVMLYLRYSQAGWQGDMDMPPQPLVPYADW